MSPARYRALAALAAGALGFARAAAAQETETRGGFSLRTSVKCQLLVSRAGDDPLLFADRDRAVSLWWPVLRTTSLSWRQEIDRAYVALHLGGLELTAGRQAIGWGRSVLFGAVDLFSPFTPLEADREWRRGVDAVRADVMLTDRASLDLVAAFGSRLDDSTLAARLRGYAGKVDLELVGGRRGRDPFGGLATSAAVGDAELHGELALFRARESRTPSPSTRTVVKATVGGSRRFPVGEGLAVYAEYH
jgi:hypothetical protein